MDLVTISILGGMMTVTTTVMVTVMIYLDRTRRAEMNAGFMRVETRTDQLDDRMGRMDKRIGERMDRLDERMDRMDERMGERIDRLDERMDHLITIVIDLAKTVGELKGRAWRASPPVEALSTAD